MADGPPVTGLLASALDALRSGLVVGMPTDTVYGIAADPLRAAAVERLFAIKGRPPDKPIPILVADAAQARRIGVLEARAAAAVDRYWPGALTVVVRRIDGLPDWIGDPGADTVGLRAPDHPVALALLRAFGPLAVTSANRSGEPAAPDDTAARAALGAAAATYLPGAGSGGGSSTVVDLTGPESRVLRSGPIDWEER